MSLSVSRSSFPNPPGLEPEAGTLTRVPREGRCLAMRLEGFEPPTRGLEDS